MFTIIKLKMWKDPGYTRQCVEVPPPGSKKLPSPDWVSSENLRPRRGSTLSAIELPLSYLEVYEMSYLYMEAEDGRDPANTISVFGWILSIEETASGNEAVRITWTPDYWRTYSDRAVFGKGTITRCANATYKRPSGVQPRRWKVNKKEKIIPNANNDRYIVIVFSQTTQNPDITYIRYGSWKEGSTITSGGQTYNTVSLAEIYSGVLDEKLGLDPEAIIGIYACTSAPFNFSLASVFTTGTYAMYINRTGGSDSYGMTYSGTYVSDDTHMTVICDPYGTIVWTLAWGLSITQGGARFDLGTSNANMIVYFDNQDGPGVDYIPGATGLMAMLPLLNLPLNLNAWSSYAFTYAREYDKRNREVARNQKAVSGLASSGQSAIGGAIAGATAGPVGAIAGAVAGLGSATLGTGIDWLVSGIFNDELQAETDKYYSHQSANMLAPAGGKEWTNLLGDWYLVELIGDDVSVAEHNSFITNNGYNVEIAVGNPNAFISAGGPLQIQNLMVTGPIPPEAKTNIKNILSNGVRIVENNPTGVNP